ncbi:GNAT family N-acetyltransferase [Aliiglaciecola sp. CAU 1673]|uniref:GNAT family N-acetyltransferase n=1 Tax=Aliiglaciecola sp. CAU 1673 TaxID=3032595 RepID=UPI0023DC115B|nr:GNAT family N-acetyltransferase [Aliiglaciecola sp. CAU 1673]MDF2179635.1 GNAT family N-acetyltransferase [Aliiglaciecola sp. CAU 1673]
MSAATLSEQEIKAVFLSAEDLKVACSILYQAYHDDPLFMQIFQVDKEGYESRLRAAIREELNSFWMARQPMIGLFEGERLLAVACLISPDACFGPGRFWHWRLKMLLTAGFFGTRQMVEKEIKVKAHVPAAHYHMLSFIGVHPDHQHHGLGHILMGAIDTLLQEDPVSEGVAVYVTVPKCKAFFEDGEYQLLEDLETGQIKGQLMFRKRQ